MKNNCQKAKRQEADLENNQPFNFFNYAYNYEEKNLLNSFDEIRHSLLIK